MRNRRKTILGLTVGVVLSLATAACGSSGSSGTSASTGRLDGVTITVGSKDFTENILLGKMLVWRSRTRARRSTTRPTSVAPR